MNGFRGDMLLLVETLMAAVAGAKMTYALTHGAEGRPRMSSIRAAGLSSIAFVSLAYVTGSETLHRLEPAFFGATFVAMSEPYRLSGRKVVLAGIIFGLILFTLQKTDFFPLHKGVGGTLGGTAFVACIAVYWMQWLLGLIASSGSRSTK